MGAHDFDAIGRGHVFEHHPQGRETHQQGDENIVDEALFPVEDIDVGMGDLAVDQERNGMIAHGGEHGIDFLDC